MAETTAFWETLRRARIERGISLAAAAGATRVAQRYLDALEKGEIEALPSGPFGRSYLRSYAEFLGLDPAPMLDSYRSTECDKGIGPAEAREKAIRELANFLERRSRKTRTPLAPVLFALVTGSGLLTAVWVSREPAAVPRSLVANIEKHPAPAPPPIESKREPPPPQEPVRPRPISVSEAGVGTRIVDHALVDRADRFSVGEQVAFWTRVNAAKPGEVIHHYWFHDGRPVMRMDLTIGGPHWRTFSRYTLPDGAGGSWVVEARDDTGRVLARTEFLCVETGE